MQTDTAKQTDARQDRADSAEQSVLGALMLDARSYWKIAGKISAEDFYRRQHRAIFTAAERVIKSGSDADIVTMEQELEGKDDVDFAYLSRIASNTPSAANILAYANIVRDLSNLRRARITLQNGVSQLDEQPLDDVVTSVMTSLQNLSHSGQHDTSFSTALDLALADAEAAEARRRDGSIMGISTTIPKLNRLTGGLSGPRMVILGGRPGAYKSAFAWQILCRAAAKGKPVGIVSLEMGASELAGRAIATECKVNGHDFITGFSPVVREAKSKITDVMRNWPLRIDDKSARLGEIMARIIEWKYRFDIQLACIDHIQLIHHDKATNRFLELSEASRQIKLLTMRLGIPILVLSQLSRDVEREKRRPVLSDLRECGNIEQDADIVMFLHCEKGPEQGQDTHELVLAKQRSGAAREVIDLVVNGQHYFIGEKQ